MMLEGVEMAMTADILSQAVAAWLLVDAKVVLLFAVGASGPSARAFGFYRVLACTACPYEATRRLIWISPLRFRHLVHCLGVNK
jgi:hypothetical protein